ncbi:MAG: ABC-ATPase domain-containing protein [Methanomicrobiales archaeon]|nr:ABC-ATPase domain-containing protein [Methanomicrobiales archaeon]
MHCRHWSEALLKLLPELKSSAAVPDILHLREGVNVYAVPSFDGRALQFAFPIVVHRDLVSEFGYPPEGSDGAVGGMIAYIKSQACDRKDLGALYGRNVFGAERYCDFIEPCTLLHSERVGDTRLWRPDNHNYFLEGRVHFSLRGAIPWPGSPDNKHVGRVREELEGLVAAVGEEAMRAPERVLREWWKTSIDQKRLRARLKEMKIVSFIGDGAMPARQCTRYRCTDEIAGPKGGVHVPFLCPKELGPCEVYLEGSNMTISGLGIRAGEVFGIIGSNAEGKSTLLQAIIAGEDDHAPGDGRERIVTVRGSFLAEASSMELRGSDVSLFFRSLPPGLEGTPVGVRGRGSASLCMAAQLQDALRRQVPVILIDEDRAAANLLVPSCTHAEDVTPLSTLLANNRGFLGRTTIVFAASALDILIAQADRLMRLEGHRAFAIGRDEFRRSVCACLRRTLEELEGAGGPIK